MRSAAAGFPAAQRTMPFTAAARSWGHTRDAGAHWFSTHANSKRLFPRFGPGFTRRNNRSNKEAERWRSGGPLTSARSPQQVPHTTGVGPNVGLLARASDSVSPPSVPPRAEGGRSDGAAPWVLRTSFHVCPLDPGCPARQLGFVGSSAPRRVPRISFAPRVTSFVLCCCGPTWHL